MRVRGDRARLRAGRGAGGLPHAGARRLVITTATIAVLPDVEAANDLLATLLERNCAAVADWGSLEACPEAIVG